MANRPKDFSALATMPAVDDFELLDGVTNGTRKLSAQVRPNMRNTLAPVGGCAFDGTGGCVVAALTNQAIADDALALSGFVDVPAGNISQNFGCFALTSSVTTATQPNSIVTYIDTATTFRGRIYGVTTSDYNEISLSLAPWAGKCVFIVIAREGSAVFLYVNGVAQTVVTTSAGNPPTWAGNVTNTYLTIGAISSSVSIIGRISRVGFWNIALSPTDVLELFETGGVVPERFKWGSQANSITNSSVTSDTIGHVFNGNCSRDTGVNSLDGASIKFTWDGVIAGSDRLNSNNAVMAFGKQYAWDSWAKADVAGTMSNIFGTVNFHFYDVALTTTWTRYVYSFTPASSANGDLTVSIDIRPGQSSAPRNAWHDQLRLRQVGCIVFLLMDDGLGFQMRDASTNTLHAVMSLTGVSHVMPIFAPGCFRAKTSTIGNEKLAGATALPGNSQILRVRARAQSGTPSVTLGTSPGLAQVVASTSLTTAWKDLAITLTGGIVSANTDLWAGSTGGNVIEWDIAWIPLSP